MPSYRPYVSTPAPARKVTPHYAHANFAPGCSRCDEQAARKGDGMARRYVASTMATSRYGR